VASRLDALIEQLMVQKADALLVEAGNTLFLVRGAETIPLVNARLTNEHVAALLRDSAPPELRQAFDANDAVDFEYASPSGPVHIEFRKVSGKSYARVTPVVAAAFDDVAAAADHEMPMPPLTDGGSRPLIEQWFDSFLATRASDLHLTPGLPAMVRSADGDIEVLNDLPIVGPYELEQVLVGIMPPQNRDEWLQMRDTDFAYDLPSARLRVNVFCDMRGPCATFRRIHGDILTVEELGLPAAVVDLCKLKKGLVLVTGPTGSGKSTTLASMIDWINENRYDHIITVEDPIEYVHSTKHCLIHQRQVGVHTRSFSRALRAALREDPNIILIGEMRDLETISLAIEMAETGHLVFGTLHTTTAATTVDRIVDQFEADKQEQVRQMVAESLKGVIAQTLCKRKDGGRVLALEILLVTTAVSNMIREKKTFQIPSVLQTSRNIGMRLLNDSLIELVKSDIVDVDEAIDRASDKAGLKRDLIAAHLLTPTSS
jgi:twitching motility protein PilT